MRLRPIAESDFKDVLTWSRDSAFCEANGWPDDRSTEELQRWWSHCVNNVDKDFLRLGIELNGELIGYADLASIENGTAELGIAIGKSAVWGKGVGAQAAVHIMEYGVKKFNLHTFYAETHEANVRSRRMLEKLKFKEMRRDGFEVYQEEESRLIQYRLLMNE
ncbi:GNAT family N-acetyltransferase [Jeotgalibacillus terrae]|uniref:GNAT family N-acetyltransferase n=1 Tax=Jeotgalibacillus terrae TaxID=587735 RepID=A0ABW5ZIW6_9BACL|nr:GNAT family N-acetyltransferase [Jeotgalibacillus terrae]